MLCPFFLTFTFPYLFFLRSFLQVRVIHVFLFSSEWQSIPFLSINASYLAHVLTISTVFCWFPLELHSNLFHSMALSERWFCPFYIHHSCQITVYKRLYLVTKCFTCFLCFISSWRSDLFIHIPVTVEAVLSRTTTSCNPLNNSSFVIVILFYTIRRKQLLKCW